MVYRLRDMVLSALLLILAAPFWLLLLPVLFLTQKKIFFVQERTGKDGVVFKMLKLSTLRDARPGEEGLDKEKDRLTPLGNWMRRYSVDELPQLINVLRGEMSLVGPRPLLHEYWPLYPDRHRRRFEVLPGITGWAQVNGRNSISFSERFELDVWYVDHQSFWLDLKILFLTVGWVFSAKDVYQNEGAAVEKYDGTN